MKILLVGSGGREHALALALGRSPRADKLYCAPGSDAITRSPALADKAEPVDLAADDVDGLLRFARELHIDLTVVGPEAPLVGGLRDRFEEAGLAVFGPSQAAAALEGSKAFTKSLLRKYHLPTADSKTFTEPREALAFIDQHKRFPLVVKADGLAAGKGVVICEERAEAKHAVERMMVHREFGAAGNKVLVEEFLQGEEASFLVITDGHTIVPMPPAKDHKAIFDGDVGPNTGGMGAYCPSPSIPPEFAQQIEREVIIPTLHALHREGKPYQGVLYAGLMLTEKGPRILEFNVRFGDPEAQVILPRLKTDLVEICDRTARGTLDELQGVEWDEQPSLIVVLAAPGYPGKVTTGQEIRGLDEAEGVEGVTLVHSGTRFERGTWRVAGGRVLGVRATGASLEQARTRAYEAVGRIHFEGMQYRRDIGVRRDARTGTA